MKLTSNTFGDARKKLESALAELGDAPFSKSILQDLYDALIDWEVGARYAVSKAGGVGGFLIITPNREYSGLVIGDVLIERGYGWLSDDNPRADWYAREMETDLGYTVFRMTTDDIATVMQETIGAVPVERPPAKKTTGFADTLIKAAYKEGMID